ncbi:MAG TPA: hypothetical protein PKE29_01870 [Phycisphaerales bacterium]|nr:hypothetical protein [Phycisphaerales bacterium]
MRIAVAVVTVAACAGLSHATVNYGDFNATHYVFQGVTENSTSPGHVGQVLFGAPTVSDDSLKFSPLNFASQSTAAPGGFATDTVDGLLQFNICANQGSFIGQFNFNERGDYTLNGLPTAFANATVGCAVNILVSEVNGVAISPVGFNGSLAFSNGGNYVFPVNAGTAVTWTGTGSFNVDAFLASLSIPGHATKVEISIDNVLTTLASDGSTARIVKKQAEGVTIDVIPAPGAGTLLGLGGLLAARRRRRRA